MSALPIFLSVVFVVRNQSTALENFLIEAGQRIASLVSDYELIVVDNASSDDSIIALKRLTCETGLPNIQIYALTKEVDTDTAAWVGLENALGDFVAVVDPCADSIEFLDQMLDHAVKGLDVVFATNEYRSHQSFAYQIAFTTFNWCYRWFNGIHLGKEAPQYRVLSKRVVNFILQHPQPSVTYRHLPASGGFSRANLNYSAKARVVRKKSLIHGVERGIRLLVSTTHAPMRVVTFLSLFGAAANIVYSFYVIVISLFKTDVAPGWVSLSLQQSGMFFLISLVLLVLGEYILHMASLSNGGPAFHVGQEFTSARMTRREKLNIEYLSEDGQHPHLVKKVS